MDEQRIVTINIEIPQDAAWDFAQFLKRVGWTEFQQNAASEKEAYRIKDACYAVQKAFADHGFSPR